MTKEQQKDALFIVGSTLRQWVEEKKERPSAEEMKSLAEDMAAALVAASEKLGPAT